MWWFRSPEVRFGQEALDSLSTLKGSRIFFVTDKNMVGLGILDLVLSKFAAGEIIFEKFAEVEPEPALETVLLGLERVKEFRPDWIIGIGGGSCLDVAKAISVLYENPGIAAEDISPLNPDIQYRKKAGLIAIPTTSGTGSETTWVTMITSKEEKRKLSLAHPSIIPDIAVVDPLLVAGLPPRLTAATGFDALVHAIEAYSSDWKNDFSDGLALDAIKLILGNISAACGNPQDIAVREKMHNAASIAGLAFGNSQAGLIHALGHTLGAIFKVPHGESLSIVFLNTFRFNSKTCLSLYADIGRFVGIYRKTDDEVFDELYSKLDRLLTDLRLPKSLKDFGVSREDFEGSLELLIDNTVADPSSVTTIRPPNNDELRELLVNIYEGTISDI
ncbi:MAG TPA: iron-containing alcohol dehydrogenase [Syntrophales bacterium]|nr:iron-containing alcohol dehydrogenase [Syntrophales bacterium]